MVGKGRGWGAEQSFWLGAPRKGRELMSTPIPERVRVVPHKT